MRKLIICAAVAFALAPLAAFATTSPRQAASKDCSALRAKIGSAAFTQAFGGSNAFGNCVLKKLQASTAKLTQALVKASKTCKAMRRSDPTSFRQKYGSRPNAFAKCVSAKSKLK